MTTRTADDDTYRYLPSDLVDAHHHFLDTTDTGNKRTFQAFLGSLLPNEQYLPGMYYKDVVEPLAKHGISLQQSVHVECIPDDGVEEVAWIDALSQKKNNAKCTVRAIVASCDLTRTDVDKQLQTLVQQASPERLRGVRWILDCVGKFEPDTATHIATSRHDGIDYLRGSDGGYSGTTVPSFEHGFAKLAKYQLSFDLQCAPIQLPQAAILCSKYPNVPVCIDHLGKPRMLLGPDTESDNDSSHSLNTKELETWKAGMQAMAKLPHVYVKLSMMGYAVPGWIRSAEKQRLLKSLVQDVLEWFTPRRCMVALNWWKDAATSDADGMSTVGPSPIEYVRFIAECLEQFSAADKERVFGGTAKEFYRLS